MKKRILFVITQFYKGGAETSLLNLFKLLDSDKYEVDFVILNQEIYQDATSLVAQIPDWIQTYNVLANAAEDKIVKRYARKIYRRLFHAETYSKAAADFVKDKYYDIAFSFGEWLSPRFVARKVKAKRKYVWIHIDIDKADFVNCRELIKYDNCITGYIFASENSMKGALIRCPQMTGKTTVIHNFLNCEEILKKSDETLCLENGRKPYLLSVGNLRAEKNYPRQVEVMKQLCERKIPIRWLCIGSTVNETIFRVVKEKISEYHLEDKFILCGADENPYKYMKNAEAVMVLSDYESWSLVITEAKILGIPVIATNTSGAQEQIIDKETGIITDFDALDIASKTELFLKDLKLQQKIRQNLKDEIYRYRENGIKEFETLLGYENEEKSYIYH